MDNSFITTYKDLESLKPKTFRGVARNLALNMLSLGVSESDFRKPRIQILYIHHLFKDEEHHFRGFLDILRTNHTFISYSEAIDKIVSGEIDKPYITFSSDDGFKNNLRAAEILNEYGAKCCFFINPGIIGVTDQQKIKEYCIQKLQFHPVDFMSWSDLNTLQKAGHEIGNHTMWHMNIAKNTEKEIRDDLGASLELLRKNCGDIQHFAFPFGRFFHFSQLGKKIVFETGHSTCATAERGCHINPDKAITKEELCIHRDHMVFGNNIKTLLYFLANSSKTANVSNNYYPQTFQ